MPGRTRSRLRRVCFFGAACLLVLVARHWLASDDGAREERGDRFGPRQRMLSLREAFASLSPHAERQRARLMSANVDAWCTRWRLLRGARTQIDASYFLIDDDVFGAAFLGHLLAKAQAGVRVRLLVDGAGMRMRGTNEAHLRALDAEPAAEVRVFHPLHHRLVEALLAWRPDATLASDHDKILVVDGEQVVVGGRNVGGQYFAPHADRATAFDDLDVVLSGRAVARALTRAFLVSFEAGQPLSPAPAAPASARTAIRTAYRAMEAWLAGATVAATTRWETLRALPTLRGALADRPERPTLDVEVRVLDSAARWPPRGDPITRALRRLARAATRRIVLESPYLVLSDEAVDVLAAAARRGVAITVLTNSPISTDNALSQAFFLAQWPDLLARVPTMRLFVRGDRATVHGKLATFDDQVGVVGTYNLDPLSMRVDGEVAVVAWSAAFAERVSATVEAVLQQGPPVVYQYRIERDANGDAITDGRGRPRVAFGPRDHADPAQWERIRRYWQLLQVAERLGLSPMF